MMKCNVCGEFFNPEMLSEVFEHEHNDKSTTKEYYGKKRLCSCKPCKDGWPNLCEVKNER